MLGAHRAQQRPQNLPVLSNLLVVAPDNRVTFTGTDLEV